MSAAPHPQLVPEPAEALVLGLWGVSRAGKSTVAGMLEDYGFARVNTGRLIAEVVLEGEGLADAFDAKLDYEHLKINLPGFHQKLVTYGNAVRRAVGSDVWSEAVAQEIEKLLSTGQPVVWENVRTHADYMALRALGGKLVRVHRPSATEAFSLLDLEIEDNVRYTAAHGLHNNGTLKDLEGAVERMLGRLR